jgi:hypothetical protein
MEEHEVASRAALDDIEPGAVDGQDCHDDRIFMRGGTR